MWTSRQYESEADLLQMQNLLMQGRAQTNDWYYPHVGDLIFWYFMVVCHLNSQEFIRLWHNEQGKLIGYAILGEDPSFDCQVLPEYVGDGIELEALAWAERQIAELIQQDAGRWGGMLVSGARQDDLLRIAFLEEHGFQRGEYAEVNMICTLEGQIPETIVPAGYQVREYGGKPELTHRAAAHRQVWHPWTVGNISDENYATFMHMPGYEQQLDVVAVASDGVIAAYVNGWLDPLNQIGDFGPVGARQAYRRQGLTKSVLLECMRRMQERGMKRVSVSTGETNVPGLRLYESVGFKVENKYFEYVKNK
jgi:ribosomal protein S18 acetylase RimI-like enzyme